MQSLPSVFAKSASGAVRLRLHGTRLAHPCAWAVRSGVRVPPFRYMSQNASDQKSALEQEDAVLTEEELEGLDDLVDKVLSRENESAGGGQESSRFKVPKPGQSSGNKELDTATRRWRSANTEDDENLKEIFQKEKNRRKLRQSQMSGEYMAMEQQQVEAEESMQEDHDDEIRMFMAEADDKETYVEEYNEKTGERYGPKGPEPTRYGDWERKGRVSDF